MQSLCLADRLPGARIVAVDNHLPFLRHLRAAAVERQRDDRLVAVAGDMGGLGLRPGTFDLIWCEGAIYIVGVREALAAWRPLLRPGGHLAFSDATWRRDDPPAEARRWWSDEGATVRRPDELLGLVEAAGYTTLGHFELAESAWWDPYYSPLLQRADEVEARRAGSAVAARVVAAARREVEIFRRHHDSYTYTFVVARRH